MGPESVFSFEDSFLCGICIQKDVHVPETSIYNENCQLGMTESVLTPGVRIKKS